MCLQVQSVSLPLFPEHSLVSYRMKDSHETRTTVLIARYLYGVYQLKVAEDKGWFALKDLTDSSRPQT